MQTLNKRHNTLYSCSTDTIKASLPHQNDDSTMTALDPYVSHHLVFVMLWDHKMEHLLRYSDVSAFSSHLKSQYSFQNHSSRNEHQLLVNYNRNDFCNFLGNEMKKISQVFV